jgi:hypothetical protein
METNYNITIPKPCHEDWDKMTPNETGRFCGNCAKSVVDFTGMKTHEIQDYFIKNQGQKVCGRFQTKQLDSIIIQIPRKILFSQVQFHKMFMLALLVSMGTTLFSCQNSTGEKQTIGKVEVVDSITENRTTGVPLLEKNDTVVVKGHGKQIKKDSLKLVNLGKTNQVPAVTGITEVIPGKRAIERKAKGIYLPTEVEVRPSFPGGLSEFYKYFKSNFKLSEAEADDNKMMVISYVIEKDGSLSTIKVLRGDNKELINRAVEVLKASPKWNPGESGEEKVRVSYSLPIHLNKD